MLHYVILELDNGDKRTIAITPAAMKVLFKLGQLIATARRRIAGGYLRMILTLLLALEQQINVIAMIVAVPFELLATARLEDAVVPHADTFALALLVLP